ncbi:hypothetical protein RRG08_050292 [Elysia crispata]|uniref:Uncharacterized protein n=1 Tax=Elysia crispata TaxID=231223 RepID=A0AAE1A8N6_9GAST|nr:hypothetical protein RRG08_050292 [Elysia crispata]
MAPRRDRWNKRTGNKLLRFVRARQIEARNEAKDERGERGREKGRLLVNIRTNKRENKKSRALIISSKKLNVVIMSFCVAMSCTGSVVMSGALIADTVGDGTTEARIKSLLQYVSLPSLTHSMGLAR